MKLFCVQREWSAHLRDRLTLRLLRSQHTTATADHLMVFTRHNSPHAPMASQTFFGHGPTRAFALGYGASRFTQINDDTKTAIGSPASCRTRQAGGSPAELSWKLNFQNVPRF